VAEQALRGRATRERRLPREQKIEHAGETVDIRPFIHFAAGEGHFGRCEVDIAWRCRTRPLRFAGAK
jgi:hypothetical protein